uniref:Uncharacterized protein n=1 Tax=Corethron hystrix TaxID=216773 RepID=A0A6U5E1I5_9STRA
MPNNFTQPKGITKGPSPLLLSAMEMHVEISKQFAPFRKKEKKPYTGIIMRDLIDRDAKMGPLVLKSSWFKSPFRYFTDVNRRMMAYEDYVERGGYLVESDYKDLLNDYRLEQLQMQMQQEE